MTAAALLLAQPATLADWWDPRTWIYDVGGFFHGVYDAGQATLNVMGGALTIAAVVPEFGMRAAETKAATRQRILEAARQLFANKGFDSSTTRDIADAAGIARADANSRPREGTRSANRWSGGKSRSSE